MTFYEQLPGGGVVLICQVCSGRCHAHGPAKVYRPTTEGHYQMLECPVCCCHECVQLADDPIRKQLVAPMLGQSRKTPFSIEQVVSKIGGVLGLRDPEKERQKRLAQAKRCECGASAKSKCISCDEMLCGRCLEDHEC